MKSRHLGEKCDSDRIKRSINVSVNRWLTMCSIVQKKEDTYTHTHKAKKKGGQGPSLWGLFPSELSIA